MLLTYHMEWKQLLKPCKARILENIRIKHLFKYLKITMSKWLLWGAVVLLSVWSHSNTIIIFSLSIAQQIMFIDIHIVKILFILCLLTSNFISKRETNNSIIKYIHCRRRRKKCKVSICKKSLLPYY